MLKITLLESEVLPMTGLHKKWQAQIVFKGKTYKLGRYIDKEDAIRARKMAEEAMFGNFLKWFQDTYPDRWKRMTNTDSLKMK